MIPCDRDATRTTAEESNRLRLKMSWEVQLPNCQRSTGSSRQTQSAVTP